MIEEKSKSNFAKLLKYIGDEDTAHTMAGQYVKDHIFDDGENGLGDHDIYSPIGLEKRGAAHFNEACELINALTRDKSNSKNFDLVLTRRIFDEETELRRDIQIEVRMNRVQMIERLEWISSMDFGDDIDEWEQWRQIRMEEGFFVGR